MTPSSTEPVTTPVLGLRARKKERTRNTIRAEAMRLFADQGYAATTVEQIADAAEISPSTFFRYFPAKESLVVTDQYDAMIFEAFLAQPPELGVVRAFRAAVSQVLDAMDEAAIAEQQQRQALFHGEPALRAAMIEQFAVSIGDLAQMLAARLGRSASDLPIRMLAGAMIGVTLAVMQSSVLSNEQPADFRQLQAQMDEGFALLEALPV